MWGYLVRRAVVPALLLAAIGVGAPAAQAAPGDIGFPDHTYSPLDASLTGSKPESKLWFNNGSWWATMFDPASATHHIYKLDRSTETFRDQGTVIDTRGNSRADVLWDGTHLYVASHVFDTTPSAGQSRLWRYSYSTVTDRYTLDAGFPAAINAVQTETLVIDKDSTGTLWATWMQGNRIMVNHTTSSDATWSTPIVVPGPGTTVSSDDISSVVHFGGNRIGIMWSNQVDHQFWFAIHNDGDPDTTWTSSAVTFPFLSDDHINLKAGDDGRVYAAVKTSETTSTRPLISLLVRSTSGTWTNHTFGTVSNSHTRPIVELDEERDVIHVYATGPSPPATSGQSGGTIYEKTSPMGSISLPTGLGTPVIREAAAADMNDATSTKQNLSASTGIVVMANNATSNRYWHSDDAAPTQPPPPPPPSGAATLTPTADTWMGDGAVHGTETHVDMSNTPTKRTAYIRFTNDVNGTGGATLRFTSPTASSQPSTVKILCASPVLTESMSTPPCAASAAVATLPSLRIGVNEVAIPQSATPQPGQTITYVLERVQSNGGLIAIASRETSTPPQLVYATTGGSEPPPPPPPPPPGGSTLVPTADTWMGDGAVHGTETHVDMSNTPTKRTAYIRFTNSGTSTGGATLRFTSPTASSQPSTVKVLCASPVLTEQMSTPPCAASAAVATLPSLRIGVNEVAIPAASTPQPGQTITYVLERVQSNGGLIAIASRETSTPPQLVFPGG